MHISITHNRKNFHLKHPIKTSSNLCERNTIVLSNKCNVHDKPIRRRSKVSSVCFFNVCFTLIHVSLFFLKNFKYLLGTQKVQKHFSLLNAKTKKKKKNKTDNKKVITIIKQLFNHFTKAIIVINTNIKF